MPRVKMVPERFYLAEKERADRWESEYRALVASLTAKPHRPRDPEPSDEERVKTVEAGALVKAMVTPESASAFVEGMVRDLMGEGLSEQDARREAKRIRDEVTSVHVHPAG